MNWIDHLWILMAGIILPVMLFIQGRKADLGQIDWNTATKKSLYLGNSIFLFGLGAISLLLWWINGYDFASLGFRLPAGAEWQPTFIVLAILVLLYVGDSWSEVASPAHRAATKKHFETNIPFLPQDKGEYLSFLKVAFAAGIGEEIMFRGYFLQYIKHFSNISDYSSVLVIGVPTLAFTMAHAYQGQKSVIKIFVFSLLLSLLAFYSNSLLIPIIIHVLVDVVSGYLAMRLLGADETKS